MKTSNDANVCQSIQLYFMLAIPQITCLTDYTSTLDILRTIEVLKDEINDEIELDYHLERDSYYLKRISTVTAVIVSTMRAYCKEDHQSAMVNFKITVNAKDAFLDQRLDKAFMILTSGWSKENVQDAMIELLTYILELINKLEYDFSDTEISRNLCDSICAAI